MSESNTTKESQEATIQSFFFEDKNIKTVKVQNTGGGGGGGSNDDALKKKIDTLGLLEVEPGMALQRDAEISQAITLLNNNENIMLLGEAGTGKTTLVRNIAKELAKEGKRVIEIPATFFSSGTAGGSSRAIESIFSTFTPEELKNIVFFMDEIHSVANMGTFGTGDQDHDTPRNLLKPYLTGSSEKRIVLIGATTTNEYRSKFLEGRNADSAFTRRFQNITLQSFNLEQIQKIMLDKTIIDDLKKSGFKMGANPSSEEMERYAQITSYGCILLDKFAKYQSFPEKSSKFFRRLFAGKNINEVSQKDIESLISETLNVPLEVITKEIDASSEYFKLKESLQSRIVGQSEAITKISEQVLNFTITEPEKPLSFLSIGATGVGKTETAEQVAKNLSLPIIKFNMGEYKTLDTTESFVQKLSKYLKSNYTGVILFDELEKANKEVLDVILSLTDKGQIGSGQSLITSKEQIIFMTSNMIQDTLTELTELLKEDGISPVPEKLIRQIIVEETNIRPEFLGRITSVLKYNNLTPEDSYEISKMILAKKILGYEQSGISITIDEISFNNIAKEACNDIGGVRMISSNLDSFLSKITSNPEVIINLQSKVMVGKIDKVPNNINIDYTNGELKLLVNDKAVMIKEEKNVEVEIDVNSVLSRIKKTRASQEDSIGTQNKPKS